jgi:TetR/AcrR family transcriptional regulator
MLHQPFCHDRDLEQKIHDGGQDVLADFVNTFYSSILTQAIGGIVRRVPQSTATKVMRAAELFAERGLDNTKVEDIAAVTGVPVATLYYYFEGKEEILSHIFGVVLDAVAGAITGALAQSGDAAERLARAIEAHLGVFAEYPKASQALHFDLGRAARRPEIAARTASAYIDPIATVLRAGGDDGSLRPVADPRVTAVILLGATSTAAIHALAIDPIAVDPLAALRKVAGAVVPLVLEGLRAGSTGVKRRET